MHERMDSVSATSITAVFTGILHFSVRDLVKNPRRPLALRIRAIISSPFSRVTGSGMLGLDNPDPPEEIEISDQSDWSGDRSPGFRSADLGKKIPDNGKFSARNGSKRCSGFQTGASSESFGRAILLRHADNHFF